MVNQMDMCHVSSLFKYTFFGGFWHNFGSHPAKKRDGTKDGCARTPAHKRIMHKLMLGYVQSLRTILRARKAASCCQKKSLTNSMTKNVQTKIPEFIDPFQQPARASAIFFAGPSQLRMSRVSLCAYNIRPAPVESFETALYSG